MALLIMSAMQAQWVNNPVSNNFIANTSADAGEIYISTDEVSGDTYLQWTSFVGGNGWSPTLQRLNYEGVPQWGNDGIHISGHNVASWSQGFAMAATTDGGVVSCFSDENGQSYAVRINADGTFPWGEAGVLLFNGQGGSRTEAIAGNNGGVWTLGSDYTNLFAQYVYSDGSTGPVITISDNGGHSCMFGQLTLSNDNRVFVTYEKLGSGMYTEKTIHVAGYAPDGTQFSPETLLMSPQTFQSTYIHHAIPDGLGGGYVYLWHPALYHFNTYVFHFDANGVNTMTDPNGTPVHSFDANNLYIDAYATVDPESHDIIVAYEQTDAAYQTQCKIYINRITSWGERLWDNGILVLDNGTTPCGGLRIDAFEYEPGFSVIYQKRLSQTNIQSTVEAHGFNMNGEVLWNTTLCSNAYDKTSDRNSSGFHLGQNIVAWVNAETGGLYGQNIGVDGSMGPQTPPTPPEPCDSPTDFIGFYSFDSQCNWYGTELMWTAPERTPLHYNLYRENLDASTTEIIEIEASATEYIDNVEIGEYTYRLTAVYENCESDYAMTPEGEYYVFIEVTAVNENADETIVTVTKVYTLQGQLIKNGNLENLSHGIYIVQGLTSIGKLVNRKMVVE